MKTKSNKVTKGMIFAGCSFTWGQGLYYYSNMGSLKYSTRHDDYDRNRIDDTHIRFMEYKRFARLVANHFDTFEMVIPFNGGSNESSIKWWSDLLSGKRLKEFEYVNNPINPSDISQFEYVNNPINPSDISHLIFQSTQTFRNNFDIEFDGKTHRIPYCMAYDKRYPYVDTFWKLLNENNLTLEEWQYNCQRENINMIKSFLEMVEGYGIKTTLFSWTGEGMEFIESDEWLSKRFLRMNYENKLYDSLNQLMDEVPEMVIFTDYKTFIKPPIDHHPSLSCHRVIAENIINFIKNDFDILDVKKL